MQKQLCLIKNVIAWWVGVHFYDCGRKATNREVEKVCLRKVWLYFERNFKKNLNLFNPYSHHINVILVMAKRSLLQCSDYKESPVELDLLKRECLRLK